MKRLWDWLRRPDELDADAVADAEDEAAELDDDGEPLSWADEGWDGPLRPAHDPGFEEARENRRDPEVVPARREPIIESHGDWTITIYDDQPITEGQKVAVKSRIVIEHKGRVWREGLRDSYTIWTVLAHWKDGLPDEPFPDDPEVVPATDRDKLAEALREHLPSFRLNGYACTCGGGTWTPEHVAEHLDLTAHAAAALAPIHALADQGRDHGEGYLCIPDDDLRAALGPAAVATRNATIAAQALRDAADAMGTAASLTRPSPEWWAEWLRDRADTLTAHTGDEADDV